MTDTYTYKRAVFVGPRQIRFDQLPMPKPGLREALIRVHACALCTWEQRMYAGGAHSYPISGGHELSGELVELGSQVYVDDLRPGDRVVASTLTRCGYCESCRRGMTNICDNMQRSFHPSDVAGPEGLAEYLLLEDYQLYRASNEISYQELSLSEPLACVIRSVRKSGVERGDHAVVVGAGIMGMLHLMLLNQLGVRVVVSEVDPVRIEFARKMGAYAVIDPTQRPFVDQVKELTGGRGADVIYCAVSIAAVVAEAVEAVAKGGRVHVYASIYPRSTEISIDPNPFHSKEIVLTGTVSHDKEDVLRAVRMISQGQIDLKPCISLVLPFEKLEEGLRAAMRPDTYRVIVTM